ncbi:MAG: ATP phosphoribosyltransferase regulatory subunit [Oscillospiraceae bacterium]|nr:ATP phosphoribosyltransferase regulatory subunit [Oscillospiraceae bacterium]
MNGMVTERNAAETLLKPEETISFALRALYSGYGYSQYKMRKFEEYDLYARNKDFLISDDIITFTDTGGKLMALKPDVTLSIVRAGRDHPGSVQKVYYNESVYRVSSRSGRFSELAQAGIECIGSIDDYCIAETLELAVRSLQSISPHCSLELSHLSLLSEALDALRVPDGTRQALLQCVEQKNLHELEQLCAAAGADEAAVQRLKLLVRTAGSPERVLPLLRQLGIAPDAVAQLGRLCAVLVDAGLGKTLSLDFSIAGNQNYYNGVVFRGFLSGVPAAVLSGGQYDRLMQKFGRTDRAIGFAVYLDMLEHLSAPAAQYDADVLLLYAPDADLCALRREVSALAAQGLRVSAQQSEPEKFRCRKWMRFDGERVEVLE